MSNAATPRTEQSATDQMKQTASNIGQSAQDAAHTAGQKIQDAAHTAKEKVQDVAHKAGQKAEDATAALGSTMQSAADKVREKGPQEGTLGRASEGVARYLEQGGRYLEEKNLSGLADDLTGLIRRHPFPAVMVAAGLGLLLGRALRS
jgi:ElaB/YqjD/DUF883 family membrane-anchored ribosome-binding protein